MIVCKTDVKTIKLDAPLFAKFGAMLVSVDPPVVKHILHDRFDSFIKSDPDTLKVDLWGLTEFLVCCAFPAFFVLLPGLI